MKKRTSSSSAYNSDKFEVDLCVCHARTPEGPEDVISYGSFDDVSHLTEGAVKNKDLQVIRKRDPKTGIVYEYTGSSVREI